LFIPPLRERKEDIVPLAPDVMAHFNTELKKNFVAPHLEQPSR
jgi:transcriptional regulator with PAS, ATPase and Fis domain